MFIVNHNCIQSTVPSLDDTIWRSGSKGWETPGVGTAVASSNCRLSGLLETVGEMLTKPS